MPDELPITGQPSLVMIIWHIFDSRRRAHFSLNPVFTLVSFDEFGDVAICRLDLLGCLLAVSKIDARYHCHLTISQMPHLRAPGVGSSCGHSCSCQARNLIFDSRNDSAVNAVAPFQHEKT